MFILFTSTITSHVAYTLALALKSLRNMAARLPQMGTNPQHATLIIFKKKKSADLCVSRPDAAAGMTPEEAGRGPARGQSRLTTMELQQIPAACLPACQSPGRLEPAPQSKKTNKQKEKKTRWDGICVRTTAPGLAAAHGSDAGGRCLRRVQPVSSPPIGPRPLDLAAPPTKTRRTSRALVQEGRF